MQIIGGHLGFYIDIRFIQIDHILRIRNDFVMSKYKRIEDVLLAMAL